jgi:prepilin-type N-terminal cleavage/methylation domain-containing protein
MRGVPKAPFVLWQRKQPGGPPVRTIYIATQSLESDPRGALAGPRKTRIPHGRKSRHDLCSVAAGPVLPTRPLLRSGRLRARPLRGFTLLEVVTTVIIVGILTAAALPGFAERMRDRRTNQAAQEIALMYRTARARAMGRGAAQLVRFLTANRPQGELRLLEAVQPTAVAPALARRRSPTVSRWARAPTFPSPPARRRRSSGASRPPRPWQGRATHAWSTTSPPAPWTPTARSSSRSPSAEAPRGRRTSVSRRRGARSIARRPPGPSPR